MSEEVLGALRANLNLSRGGRSGREQQHSKTNIHNRVGDCRCHLFEISIVLDLFLNWLDLLQHSKSAIASCIPS